MNRNIKQTLASGSLAAAMCLSIVGTAGAANRLSQASSTASTANQQRAQAIISKGDQEISRRLASLGTVTTRVVNATKLSSTDKAALSSEVSTETSSLTALKTKLDAETTIGGARTDAQSIYSDYRVYALVVPKVELVKVADDQQVTEAKLGALATKLQSRIASDQSAGKDTTSLQTALNDMTAKTQAAQAISSGIESKVISLQPSDYNSDHGVLSGDNTQLKAAHNDNQTAIADAKTIIAGLK